MRKEVTVDGFHSQSAVARECIVVVSVRDIGGLYVRLRVGGMLAPDPGRLYCLICALGGLAEPPPLTCVRPWFVATKHDD